MSSFARVIPLLVYEDIPAAHDFLVHAFGFEAGGVEYDEHGRPVHAEVRAGATAIWLHRVTEEHQLSSPLAGVAGSGLVLFVDDLDGIGFQSTIHKAVHICADERLDFLE